MDRKPVTTGLHCVDVANGTVTLLRAHPGLYDSISWSPDSNAFAYGYDGKVYIYSLQAGTAKFVSIGDHPSWSPDGRRIAFRAPDGTAMAADTDSLRLEPLIREFKILWDVHRSPDSKYVMVSRAVDPVPLFLNLLRGHWDWDTTSEMVVVSLRDQAQASVGPRNDGDQDGQFYWIRNYETFLKAASVHVQYTHAKHRVD